MTESKKFTLTVAISYSYRPCFSTTIWLYVDVKAIGGGATAVSLSYIVFLVLYVQWCILKMHPSLTVCRRPSVILPLFRWLVALTHHSQLLPLSSRTKSARLSTSYNYLSQYNNFTLYMPISDVAKAWSIYFINSIKAFLVESCKRLSGANANGVITKNDVPGKFGE